LDADSRRLLDRIGSGSSEGINRLVADFNRPRTELSPGTLLTREWDGHLQRVMVLADGFSWNGKTYRSLSKVACAMTGTAGPDRGFSAWISSPLLHGQAEQARSVRRVPAADIEALVSIVVVSARVAGSASQTRSMAARAADELPRPGKGQHFGMHAYYGKMAPRSRKYDPMNALRCYRCTGADGYRFSGKAVCNNGPVRSDQLEKVVWDQVRALFEEPRRVTDEYRRRITQARDGAAMPDEIVCLDRQITSLRRGIGPAHR
jgi:hypothetical protein